MTHTFFSRIFLPLILFAASQTFRSSTPTSFVTGKLTRKADYASGTGLNTSRTPACSVARGLAAGVADWWENTQTSGLVGSQLAPAGHVPLLDAYANMHARGVGASEKGKDTSAGAPTG